MNTWIGRAASVVAVCAAWAAPAWGQDAEQPKGVALFKQQAEALLPLVKSDLAKSFLRAAQALPPVATRTLHLNREKRLWVTDQAFSVLPGSDRAGFEARPIDEDRYYQTKYGSPLAYCRVLDLVGTVGGWDSFKGKRIADYGYGTIGHLRMLASRGAEVTGIDPDPFLVALYSEKADTGAVDGLEGAGKGRIGLVDSLWPGGEGASSEVGGGYDLFLSKNTLKNGYIHPEREVEKRLLVDLSVPEEQYVRAVHDALKPGGLFVIYNLSPAPSKEGEPYKHWADGRCPFPRELLEKAGFEVLAFDMHDDEAGRRMFEALGYPTKAQDGSEDLFAHYTIARRRP